MLWGFVNEAKYRDYIQNNSNYENYVLEQNEYVFHRFRNEVMVGDLHCIWPQTDWQGFCAK